MRWTMIPVLAAVVAAGPAYAVDGVIEINQAAAIAGLGLVCGDAAGFPVTLCQPGSYVLTGDLEPTSGPVDVIQIDSDAVTLDLNGFALRGGTVCTQTGAVPNVVNCAGGGSSNTGIEVLAGPYAGIEIRNGLIGGMLVDGIDGAQATGAVVRQVRVISNSGDGVVLGAGATVVEVSQGVCGGDGITVGNGSTITSSQAFANAGSGIVSSDAARIISSNAGANVGFGIETVLTSTIVDTGASLNGSAGISVGDASVIRGVAALGNQSDGLRTGCCSVVEHSVSSSNVGDGIVGTVSMTIRGNTAVNNNDGGGGGDGIQTGLGGNIVGNTVAGSGGYGINPGDDSGYSKNVARANTIADVNTGPTRISAGDNVCSGVAC